MSDNLRTSKKVRQGSIEVDFEESTLIVNFDTEVVRVDEDGRVVETLSRTPDSRRIKIKFSSDKSMAQLADDVVQKCKYIHPSRAEEVEQLLIKLKKHVHAAEQKALKEAQSRKSTGAVVPVLEERDRDRVRTDRERDRDYGERNERDRDRNDRERDRGNYRERDYERDGDSYRENERVEKRDRRKASSAVAPVESYSGETNGTGRREKERERVQPEDDTPPARMEDLDEYLDMMYQVTSKNEKEREAGLNSQIKGSALILKLCRDVMNLETLIQNGTVMGALTRTLQEEYKKSVELTFNILRIFLAFSNFVEMHLLMAQYRIGVITMKVIEFEVKRAEHRETELKELADKLESDLQELQNQNYGVNGKNREEVSDGLRKSKEKEARKHAKMQKKQDKVLFVAFYILINLAEDVNVEKKMVKKGLTEYLLSMLSRTSADLLVLCVTFIKKLSIFEENKDVFKESEIVTKLVKFIPCSSQALVQNTLRLLFNFSFDADFREQMVKAGMVPKLVGLLKAPTYRARTLKLLYHLSVDDRCKSMFAYTDGMPVLLGMTVNFPQAMLAKELAALMVNLTLHPRNAEILLQNKGLSHLIDRLLNTKDPLLAKIIRNLSLLTFNSQQASDNPELNYKYRGTWSPHLKSLLQLTSADNQDLLVEVFGILANLSTLDLPSSQSWPKLFKDFHLMSLCSKMLVPGMCQNDMLLEIVMLISAAAADDKACEMFASSTIIQQLHQLWKEKGDDVEILLQLEHCFYRFLLSPASCEAAMYNTRVVSDIIDCLGHKNLNVRKVADLAAELVLEMDRSETGELGELGQRIRKKRFESYNRHYLEAMGIYATEHRERDAQDGRRTGFGGRDGGRLGPDDDMSDGKEEDDERGTGWRGIQRQASSVAGRGGVQGGFGQEEGYAVGYEYGDEEEEEEEDDGETDETAYRYK